MKTVDDIYLIKEDEFIRSSWEGGKTTQMFIYPRGSDYKSLNFKCRISSASVELEKTQFTKLKGVNRFITPLNKDLKLSHDLKEYIELKPYQIYEFDGEMNTYSIGKAVDFNLMLNGGAKGYLINELIKKESMIKIYPIDENSQDEFEIFYSNEMKLTFIIENNTIILNPKELLIVNTNNIDRELDVKINSKKPCNTLRARVRI